MSTQFSAIVGIGRHVPAHVRSNRYWDGVGFIQDRELRLQRDFLEPPPVEFHDEHAAFQARVMERYDRDPFRGSRERRVADERTTASDLEEHAARNALDDAGLPAQAIDVILINSCPSDDYLPNNGTELQRRLEIGPAQVIGIDSACTSFQSMLMLADSLVRCGRAKNVLIVASALMTRLTDRDDPMSITLGDGAAAAVVGPARGPGRLLAHAQRGLEGTRDVACCTVRDEHRWYEGRGPLRGHTRNVELSRRIVMDTTAIADAALDEVLHHAELSRADVTHVFTHQGAIFFNELVYVGCGLEHAKTENTFARYGSMGAANIPTSIVEFSRRDRIEPGSVVFLFSMGMGLNWAASLLRWD